MPDAGTNYYNALSGVGDDIARSMIYYHQKHVQYDQQMQLANALSRLGVDQSGRIVPIQMDEKGKAVDKNVQSIIDPKALDSFRAGNQRERERSIGGLDAINRLLTQQLGRAIGDRLINAPGTPRGELMQERTKQAQSRTGLNTIQAAKILGVIKAPPVMPTGGQILNQFNQQAKARVNERKAIENRILSSTYLKGDVADPNQLLSNVTVLKNKAPLAWPTGDLKDFPKDATDVMLDNGKKMPAAVYKRLHPQAKQWFDLGKPVANIIPDLNDPNTAKNVSGLIANPNDARRKIFDSFYGPGASAAVLNAQTEMSSQVQGKTQADAAAAPDTSEGAEETDTSGEEEQDQGDTGNAP
jgi:hypothetical protein